MGTWQLHCTAGESTSDDVTCIALKRRLLLCGTYTGALLVFAADQEDTVSTITGSSNIFQFNTAP